MPPTLVESVKSKLIEEERPHWGEATDFMRSSLGGEVPKCDDIPARIARGDTILRTVTGEWRNIHLLRVSEDQRQMIQRLQKVVAAEPESWPPIDLASFRAKREVGGQFELDLF